MQKSCMESLSSLWNNGLGIYHKAGFFLHHSVYPISQHRSYTTHLILGHYNIYLSSKTLSVKLYKVKQVCFYLQLYIFLTICIKIISNARSLATFQLHKKKSSYILATNWTDSSYGPFSRVGITGQTDGGTDPLIEMRGRI